MPNPACDEIEATLRAKPGWKGSPEPEYTRQDGALGIWTGRMTNRNRPVTHPALIGAETHVYSRVSRGERLSSFLEPFGIGRSSLLATDDQTCLPIQRQVSTPTGQRGRTGDRTASNPVVVPGSEPVNPRCRPLRRMGQPASDVTARGRRSRSSRRAGRPSTWRRAPVLETASVELAEHDMGNHHA